MDWHGAAWLVQRWKTTRDKIAAAQEGFPFRHVNRSVGGEGGPYNFASRFGALIMIGWRPVLLEQQPGLACRMFRLPMVPTAGLEPARELPPEGF